MQQFHLIASGVDVLPLTLDLARAPHLWDRNNTRRTFPGTPHAAMVDIWARFRPEADITGLESHRSEHRNVFWPAWHELPALRPIVFGLMARVCAVELGSILITRLPPGAEIQPHSDRGAWAPEYYNTKAHLTVTGRSLSRCHGEEITMRAGEVWLFDNLLVHSVANAGECDRICVIVSMRCE